MNHIELPFSPACERNKEIIFETLQKFLTSGVMLEIGHGTGQHAIYFSKKFPMIQWQPADVGEHNWMMEQRIKQEYPKIANLFNPIPIRVSKKKKLSEQCKGKFQNCYTANTLHIMSEEESSLFCEEIGDLLLHQGYLFIYGPFKFEGKFTSESNHQFDQSLKQRDPLSGIRNFEHIKSLLKKEGISFIENVNMPANNNFLIFQKD
ncbi:class I SAM-dependent methyltransferase [Bacteriovoracaceae bacterium]|nr:class I SAM-dependent methyltransferase [Bacteriovoracaceae bacterium]